MKKLIYLSVAAFFVLVSCSEEKDSITKGEWQLVYGYWGSPDFVFPENVTGSDIKIWTDKYYMHTGKAKQDTILIEAFGCGYYKFIEGNKYQETVMLQSSQDLEGKTINMLMELKNDTLIQKWPVDENWNLQENYKIEKYVRIKQ
jgi:hypothetical protein